MPKKEISLLPEQNAAEIVAGKFVKWILSVGRYIVIFTELIVIGAFMSRFWLDRRNSDLSEKIRQQKAILTSTQTFEMEFRDFQMRLNKITEGMQEKYLPVEALDLVAASLPTDVLLSDFRYFKDDKEIKASLKAQIFSEAGLAEFIDRLIASPNISTVQIGTIEKEEGKGGMTIQFIVSFTFDKDNVQKETNS
jgi:Xaa-Pro aminopeptidase